ncbi:TIGR01621 family pseudouridine synthase [Agarivorans albus]|uniref:Ribosomal large subunit pseudouridine synthase D n=1 Tax=Agarivorans albus MKT 106 TaxID=1331007 RepID=R9PGW0_AGAAL|nr:TIGR01621 family pseudouridine synthase [Agarivorans albus]GAD00582.1 ribosomal large subunit pseudouridine synthase D [Agarivorans albus MKT 106]
MQKLLLVAEHSDFIVVNKPSGINFHTESGELGLVELARQQFALDLWPVHRLDKLTSGLLLLAKNKSAAARFQELFSQGLVNKFYLALASNKPKKKQGLIKGDMLKARNGSWKLGHTNDNPAITQFFSFALLPKRRLFLLKPHTGRTHQLRVALKSLGAPILGDTRYGGEAAERGYLHAFGLQFNWGEQSLHYAALDNLDGDFERFEIAEKIGSLAKPWEVAFPQLKRS